MFSQILAACDGSNGANEARNAAAGLARLFGAEPMVRTICRRHRSFVGSVSHSLPASPTAPS